MLVVLSNVWGPRVCLSSCVNVRDSLYLTNRTGIIDTHVDEDLIRQLAKKIAKDVRTEADLGDFSKLLKKIAVETALD